MAKLAGSIKPWGSNLNHVVGDYPGEPVKVDGGNGVIAAGFIPGDVYAPTAEETNFEFNRWTSVLQWVQDGTSANDQTAHVVETNSGGDISVQRGLFTTGIAASTAVNATATGSALAAITGTHSSGNGHGVLGVVSTGLAGTYCFFGQAANGGDAGGIRTIAQGQGRGAYFTGGANALAAMQADATGTSPGGIFNGAGGEPDLLLTPSDNYGIDIQCGSGAIGGMRILANGQVGLLVQQDNPNFGAVVLFGDGLAASGVATLASTALSAGDAAHFTASTGTGWSLVLTPKAAAPSKGAIFVDAQNARPSAVTSGQFTYLSEGHWAHSQFDDFGMPGPGAGWRGVWSSIGGFALARGFVSGVAFFGLGGTYEIMVTAKGEGGNMPKIGGRKGMFKLSFSPRIYDTAGIQRINVKVRDVTAGADIFVRQGAGTGGTAGIYFPPLTSGGYREPVSLFFSATIPAAGAREWNLQLQATDTMDIRDPCLELLGLE